MLERNQERIVFSLAAGRAQASIYRLPRTRAYVCRVTFPDGVEVNSVALRMSWTTVEGAKAWAAAVVARAMEGA